VSSGRRSLPSSLTFLKPIAARLRELDEEQLQLDLRVAVCLIAELGRSEITRKLDLTPAHLAASVERLKRAGADFR
jgi:hypothetical protein